MNVEAFLLCDAATDQQGKLNVLGAFDNIFAGQLPAVHPACAVAARIRFQAIESGNHAVRMHVIDEDGHSIGPKIEGNIAIHIGEDSDSGVVNLIFNVQGLKFEKHGKYRIDLAIDGNIQASLPLRVREAPNQP